MSGKIVHGVPASAPDLTWLHDNALESVERVDEWNWTFDFRDGGVIYGSELKWRLTTDAGIVVTSFDDGHPFGLGAPVDACRRVMDTVGQSEIKLVEVCERTGDLVLSFANGAQLEFLNLSCGYESWATVHGDDNYICMGGGGFCKVEDGPPPEWAPEGGKP